MKHVNRTITILVFIFLYIPMIVLAIASFNTGTVVGIGCNVISEGFPPTFIPSFSRGGSGGFLDIHLEDFYSVAERVMARRHCSLTDAHRRLFNHIAAYADCFK